MSQSFSGDFAIGTHGSDVEFLARVPTAVSFTAFAYVGYGIACHAL